VHNQPFDNQAAEISFQFRDLRIGDGVQSAAVLDVKLSVGATFRYVRKDVF
jgi:hypothetical protein